MFKTLAKLCRRKGNLSGVADGEIYAKNVKSIRKKGPRPVGPTVAVATKPFGVLLQSCFILGSAGVSALSKTKTLPYSGSESPHDSEMSNVLVKTKKYIESGDLKTAERLLEEALQKSQKRGSDWTNIFILLLGKISLKQGNHEKAEKMYDELRLNLGKILDNSPSVQRLKLWTLIDLAQLYSETNRHHQAEDCFKQSLYALEVMSVDASDYHWAVETLHFVLDGYSNLLVNSGRLDEALAQRLQAISLCTAVYGESHPKQVYNLNELGRIHIYQGKYEEAIDAFGKAIAMTKSLKKGMQEMELAALYVNNGRAHLLKGMAAKAREYCSEALGIASRLKNQVGQMHAKECLNEVTLYKPP